MTEYTIVQDDAGDSYVIPYAKLVEWEQWLDQILESDEDADLPEYARLMDGGNLIFSSWRIE